MRFWLALLVLLPGLGWAADGVVLTYRGTNKWLAAGDMKPLQGLRTAARNGQTRFEVRLPKDNRDLAAARLEVLRDLLAKDSQKGLLLEEVDGAPAPANSLWVK